MWNGEDEVAEGGKKPSSNTPFSDPVFKKISLKNGEINKLEYHELCNLAKALKVNGKGSSDVLKRRLKSYYRNLYMNEAQVNHPSLRLYYPYYVVIDFEATCEEKSNAKAGFQHEIIEFPAVLVNSETMEIEDVFHEYVKPSRGKHLSDYCKTLTGITQEQVDAASHFPIVLHRFEEWFHHHKLSGQSALVTDGPWDMARFLYTQVKLSHLPYPKYAKRWVNLKKVFSNFYSQRKPSLDLMLSTLKFTFEGRRHSGIDDAKNISRVLIQLMKDGACVRVNERIDLSAFYGQRIPDVYDIVKPVTGDSFLLWNESKKTKASGLVKKDNPNGPSSSKSCKGGEDKSDVLHTCSKQSPSSSKSCKGGEDKSDVLHTCSKQSSNSLKSDQKIEDENDVLQTCLEESTLEDLSTLHLVS